VRLITRGAAAWFAKVELSAMTRGALAGRGGMRARELPPVAAGSAPAAPLQPPRERLMTVVRPECGLRHQPAPQLHR
jgi:hypothetical protein